MTLILHKETVTDDGDNYWFVTCKKNGGTPIQIFETYTFPDTKTEAEMETVIVANLTAKGYTELSPVEWQ